jgi:transcriptional regulator with XRE-family HTH domain
MTLMRWLAQRNVSLRAFASQLGAHPSTVWRWATDRSSPTLEHVAKIETLTRGEVRVADWLRATKRKGT